MNMQRGGFVLGLVVGLLVGLALALGVALYITKAPSPFVNKVPQRTAEQDQAETERNKHWDPNAPLGGKAAPRPAVVASAAAPAAPASAPPGIAAAPARPARDPAAILAGSATPGAAAAPPARSTAAGPEPFVYFVQTGAYTRGEEAEQQRAKLAMLGLAAKVTEREQSGRTVYRVRVGPYDTRADAESQQGRLQESSIDSQLVRVEKP